MWGNYNQWVWPARSNLGVYNNQELVGQGETAQQEGIRREANWVIKNRRVFQVLLRLPASRDR